MSAGVRVMQGDCREMMRTMEPESVQCCVTSPPYWGLRDYGVAGQLGLEKNPEEYVTAMVGVFGEVRRVLKADGTLWLNLGDTYAQEGGPGWQGKNGQRADRRFRAVRDTVPLRAVNRRPSGHLKAKDLVGIPWRVAMALQADGWYLRCDIIWHKPNPMPESVTDRPTRAHEYIFLMSKSERYFYDGEAIKEPATCARMRGPGPMVQPGTGRNDAERKGDYRTNGKWGKEEAKSSGRRLLENMTRARANGADHDAPFGDNRNKRSVWTVVTQAYPEAHFATYPPDLIKPCILAGSRPGDTVLDPFGGSGTTGQVALELGRSAVLVELNPKYVELIGRRCDVTPGLGI